MGTQFFADLSGFRITDGRITLPTVGAWHADLMLDKDAPALPADLVLSLGALSGKCAAWRPVRPYQGTTRVRVIGGRNGWGKLLPAKPYHAVAGVRMSLILKDAAKTVGETIDTGDDRIVGTHWLRESAPAQRLLNTLAPNWHLDLDGVTRLRARSSKAIASRFDLMGFDGARGVAVVATEAYEDWIPGNTFTSPQLKATLTIGAVSHVIAKSTIRTEVMAA